MTIQLIRTKILSDYRHNDGVNPGLLLYKGLPEIPETNGSDSNGDNVKTEHINKICNISASQEYKQAFKRWCLVTHDQNRFGRCAMQLENRLLIGVSAPGPLETGCTLSRNYGMPYIPGSSVKGVVRAWISKHATEHASLVEQLLGTYDVDGNKQAISGLVTFHDAWWVPKDSDKPFIQDIVTTHHPEYYNGGRLPPTDKDSPIPNALIAVTGSFLFVLEGKPEHVKICQTILQRALNEEGIGAKTSSGYGYMHKDNKWTRENLMSEGQQLEDEVRGINEKNLAEMFSKKN
ncbi:type III-B CRISPR module RAMP protein Cmr6 [Gynuella sp.]|uniref:type III-B CRISPR module RAMP protein Cmr6 n=1 Tax=Gynuella sp. TaxID=2969146 RepID=UPI003D0EC96F